MTTTIPAQRTCICCGWRRAYRDDVAGEWGCYGCGWIEPDRIEYPACPDCGEPVCEADGWACDCKEDAAMEQIRVRGRGEAWPNDDAPVCADCGDTFDDGGDTRMLRCPECAVAGD